MAKNVANLDLETIKANLKNYLKQQNEFKDFNFEGSAISTLIDLLAYFIQYIGFYTNATFNEMFLETAQIRKNVVTLAKALGYYPRRKVASRITGTIKFLGNKNIAIPSSTKFVGHDNEGKTFQFETREIVNLNSDNDYQSTIVLYQQETVWYETTYDSESNTIVLPYGDEIEQLFVFVNDELWNFYDYKIDLTGDSKVYFLEEDSETGKLVISFGNNLFGKQPENGSKIKVKMYITQGSAGNDINDIELADIITDNDNNAYDKNDFELVFNEKSSGGQDEETIESIKLNAPRMYETQNRLVTERDYKDFLSTFDFVDAYSVWGGEKFKPPVYGTVFLAIKPTNGKYLTTEQKNELLSAIKEKQIVSLRTQFLDPEYIDIDIDVTAWYYKNKGYDTTILMNNIKDAITQYFQSNDIYFYSLLKYSKLIDLVVNIEGISHCEISYITSTTLLVNPNDSYIINVFNALKPNSIKANDFIDDGKGNLVLKSTNDIIGNVDYTNGVIKFEYKLPETPYTVYYDFENQDIAIQFNVLLNLNSVNVTLNTI